MDTELKVQPVTPDRWEDLERLFGLRGACGGCWYMWWRLTRSEYERCKGEINKQALKGLVQGGKVPGLLAYRGGEPIAWVSLGPREFFPRLDRSRVLKRVDEEPVWYIVCFYLPRAQRGKGLSGRLLKAAIEYARDLKGTRLEAYPIDPKGKRTADVFAYTGFASTFERAGFVEVERRSPARPIMRLTVGTKNRK